MTLNEALEYANGNIVVDGYEIESKIYHMDKFFFDDDDEYVVTCSNAQLEEYENCKNGYEIKIEEFIRCVSMIKQGKNVEPFENIRVNWRFYHV